jgi:homocysteine S-methyltransferase
VLFAEAINTYPFFLTEGAFLTRLTYEMKIDFDPNVLFAHLIYKKDGRNKLTQLYKGYYNIGMKYDLPMLSFTSTTWRANQPRLKKALFLKQYDVNADTIHFVNSLRQQYGSYSKKIFIGGLIGCKGDAYKSEEALSVKEALSFHRFQVKKLNSADFLFATALPAFSEAYGLAMAMSESTLPYILSFVQFQLLILMLIRSLFFIWQIVFTLLYLDKL